MWTGKIELLWVWINILHQFFVIKAIEKYLVNSEANKIPVTFSDNDVAISIFAYRKMHLGNRWNFIE